MPLSAQERAAREGLVRNGVTTETFNCLREKESHPKHLWQAAVTWFTCFGEPAPPPHRFEQGPYVGLCQVCDGGKGDNTIHIMEVTPVTRPRKPWRVELLDTSGKTTSKDFTSEAKAYELVQAERAALRTGQNGAARITVREWYDNKWGLFEDHLERDL